MLHNLLHIDKKTEKNIYKIAFVSVSVLIIIAIVLLIYIFFINKNKKETITSPSSFSSVKQVVEYMESEYYNLEHFTNNEYNIYLKFKVKPIDDKISYENYYNNMIKSIATVLKFDSFKLIDTSNDINISVSCDKKYNRIKDIIINGESNYFENRKSKLNLENYTKVNNISVNVNSTILTSLINNNFNYNENLFGIKDSTVDKYDIYFDEGMYIRSVEGKVFNIIFTEKYNKDIINNISVGKSFDEIKNILGEPTFKDDYFIGYKSDKFYIFFLENQVSIYRVEKFDTNEFAKIVDKFLSEKNSKNLVNSLINIWPDYDKIRFEGNSINLLYTLKGVNIQFNYILKHGIHIYSNFKGNITENISFNNLIDNPQNLPENVYFESEDLVYQNELKRAHSFHNMKYFYPQFKMLTNDIENITKNGGYVEEVVSKKDDSGKFICYKDTTENFENITFILSNDDSAISSQIDVNMSSHIWLSDSILAYSVENSGIYLYDAINLTNKTIYEGYGTFELKSYENNVLYFDNTKIDVNI